MRWRVCEIFTHFHGGQVYKTSNTTLSTFLLVTLHDKSTLFLLKRHVYFLPSNSFQPTRLHSVHSARCMLTMASTRSYFNPTEVPDEVSRSARGCVDACMAFLGHTALEGAPWSVDTLRGISPEGCVLRSLNNLGEIMTHLDNLYVAIMNKNGGVVGHAAVLYRSEDQMGTTECHLYNPGGIGRSIISTVDLSRERDTARWNYICAVFIPGTDIPTETTDTVDLTLSNDDDEDGFSGSDGAAASSQTSSSSSTPASQSQTASAQRNEVNEYSPTRRQPSRATKSRLNNSLFYKERLVPTAREDYRRVDYDDYSSVQLPDQCTKEMIGQNVARYLLNTTKWVVWFHLSTSEYVIAKKEAFRSYDIEEAELGKCRFIGYASLAEWAFQEGIYEQSIQDAAGKVFLKAVGLSACKLSSSTSSGKKRRTIRISDDGAQKKKKKQHAASGDQLV